MACRGWFRSKTKSAKMRDPLRVTALVLLYQGPPLHLAEKLIFLKGTAYLVAAKIRPLKGTAFRPYVDALP